MAEPTNDDLVVGLSGAKRRWWLAGCVALATCTVVTVISALVDHMWSAVPQSVFSVYLTTVLWLRFRAVRADRCGIRRRNALQTTSWSEIEELLEPGRWDDDVKLRTTAGKILTTGLPATHLDQLAALSGKPVQRRASTCGKPPTKEQRDLSERESGERCNRRAVSSELSTEPAEIQDFSGVCIGTARCSNHPGFGTGNESGTP